MPRALKVVDDPVGPDNDPWIVRAAHSAHRVVVAWGVRGTLFDHDAHVLALWRIVRFTG